MTTRTKRTFSEISEEESDISSSTSSTTTTTSTSSTTTKIPRLKAHTTNKRRCTSGIDYVDMKPIWDSAKVKGSTIDFAQLMEKVTLYHLIYLLSVSPIRRRKNYG